MAEEQCFEVDFLAVGEGEKCGDAIAIRFGTPGNYEVLVFDGGTKDAGAALVKHIREHYKTERVDYVVNSHPDRDHASGLSVVLEELDVGELWMHQPWNYSDEIRHYFHDGRITDDSLARRLQEKMAAAYTLEELATQKDIPIYEPFAGSTIGGVFKILSPNRDWYVHTLIQEFAKSPDQKKNLAEALGLDSIYGTLKTAAESVMNWIQERWDFESLREDVTTSAENESSVVLFGGTANRGILLTGDAGVRALHKAADFADSIGLSLKDRANIVQIPHHGGRHNVSTTALDRILGERLPDGTPPTRQAIASVGKACETHPRPVVVNAFIRRGYTVAKTKGTGVLYRINAPERPGWNKPIPSLSFANKVEAWE